MSEKKWIVVTGASSGIGKSTVTKLAEEGYFVVATARNKEKLAELYGSLANVEILPWDLEEIQEIKEYAKKVKEVAGAVSGLVHCAGVQAALPIHIIKEEKLQGIFGINTFAAMMLVSAFSKKGMALPGASFVLISSLSAHEGAYGQSVYAASKGAIEGFVRGAAPELAEKGIRINAIAPGMVQTEMVEAYFAQLTEEQRENKRKQYPLGLGEPEDISAMIVFLLSNQAKWYTGQTMMIDGGHMARKC